MKFRVIALALLIGAPAMAQNSSPSHLIARYEAEAGAPASPERGEALFLADHAGGKPGIPSCTTCHTSDPRAQGQARTGKVIEPLAPSANPLRFTDVAHVEKWFGRNCDTVLGRECTPSEKANIIAWLAGL